MAWAWINAICTLVDMYRKMRRLYSSEKHLSHHTASIRDLGVIICVGGCLVEVVH